jgi:N-acetyl-alpha-D-glucosaminyl L-malate synthase BshA
MMRIAISCHPTQGGSGVVATELALALAERGHEMHVVSYERPFRLADRPNICFHRVNVSEYPLFKYPPHDLTLANLLAEVAVTHELDIIHAHYAVPHTVSAMLARDMLGNEESNVKVVSTVHGTDITLVGSNRDFYRICRYAMMKDDGTTAVSNWLADETQQTFNLPDRPVVIPNFVDCDRFTSKGRVDYPEDGAFVLLHASNFRPVKRVFDVIRVFQQVRKRLPNARLIMAGDGPERGSACELAAELGVCDAVEFPGSKMDIEQAYRNAHLFLLLSEYESFGLSALEALACGTPVLGTASGGLIEVVSSGQNGRLCGVGQIDDMAEATVDMLSEASRWRQYSLTAKTQARKQYCKNLIVPQYEAFYESVIAGQQLSPSGE